MTVSSNPLQADVKLFQSIYYKEIKLLETKGSKFAPSQGFFSAVHDLLRKYSNEKIYYNDRTFVKLWLLFATYLPHWKGDVEILQEYPPSSLTVVSSSRTQSKKRKTPKDVFQFMVENKIGKYLSMYYLTAANYYESIKEISQCANMLKLGIEMHAEPTADLIQALKDFQERRAKLNNQARSIIQDGFLIHPITGNECSPEELRAYDYFRKLARKSSELESHKEDLLADKPAVLASCDTLNPSFASDGARENVVETLVTPSSDPCDEEATLVKIEDINPFYISKKDSNSPKTVIKHSPKTQDMSDADENEDYTNPYSLATLVAANQVSMEMDSGLEEISVVFFSRFILRHLLFLQGKKLSRAKNLLSTMKITYVSDETATQNESLKASDYVKYLDGAFSLSFDNSLKDSWLSTKDATDAEHLERHRSLLLQATYTIFFLLTGEYCVSLSEEWKLSSKYMNRYWQPLLIAIAAGVDNNMLSTSSIDLLLGLSEIIILENRKEFPSLLLLLKKYEVLLYEFSEEL